MKLSLCPLVVSISVIMDNKIESAKNREGMVLHVINELAL